MKRLLAILLAASASAQAASTQIGVVYSTGQGQLRRVIVPDDDSQLTVKNFPLQPGEAFIVVPKNADVIAEIKKVTGKDPTEPMAAIVGANGLVEEMIMADPTIDKVPQGKSLVKAYPGVAIGQTYDSKRDVFIAPAFISTHKGDCLDDACLVKAPADVVTPAQDVPKVAQPISPPLRGFGQ